MKKIILLAAAILLFVGASHAQVAINETGSAPNASAILDISSNDKGVLIPRMSTADRTTNITPVAGLLVYDTTTNSFWYYDGSQSAWVEISGGSGATEINELSDGINDGSSIFLGNGSGGNDVGPVNKNTAIGQKSMEYNTTGTENASVGFQSLNRNTVGYKNTAVGQGSLFANTSGNNNVALGNQAMEDNTSGEWNTSLGSLSSRDNTTGDNNTNLGYGANIYNITGSENTAVGTFAGKGIYLNSVSGGVFLGNRAGENNTSDNKLFIDNSSTPDPLIGGDFSTDQVDINGDLNLSGTIKIEGGTPGVGKLLTSDADGNATWEAQAPGVSEINDLSDGVYDGSSLFLGNGTGVNDDGNNYNTAVGEQSLNANTSGLHNTSVGFWSLKSNTGGDYNIALGAQAIQYNTTGNRNIAIGWKANYYNEEGDNNIIIGYLAGAGSAVHSKSGNIFLGYAAGYYETGDNKLYIENSESETPLIGGDFSTDQVDINGDLNLSGTIKILGGNPGADKVLTSDVDGNATWESHAMGGATEINDLSDAIFDGTSLFLGNSSGTNDDGDNYNASVGYQSLFSNTSGAHNTSVGSLVMFSNTTGSRNVAIGRKANYYNQEGNNNTIVGYWAGAGSPVHNKSGNIFLGYMAGYNETGDNKLYIENSNSPTPLIGGDFSTDQVDINGDLNISTDLNVSGNVGIGTSNPSQKLSIRDGNLSLVSEGSDSYIHLGSDELGDAIGSYIWTKDNAGFAIGSTEGVPQLIVNNVSGNVGIGTTTPSTKLEVAGQIKITGGNPGAGRVLTSDENGAATWSSSTVYATSINDLTDAEADAADLFLGDESGINNDGLNFNTGVGIQALKTNSTGISNTATGYGAMQYNTIGNANVAIGKEALLNSTTKNNLTAIGYQSLYWNGNGSTLSVESIENTAIGSKTLYSNTLGSQNTAVGMEALKANSTGSGNTSIGAFALDSNTEGEQNTAAGAYSLTSNTTADGNTAFGYKASYNVVDGDYNSSFGLNALFSTTSGTYNSAFSFGSLFLNQTGDENTAFGYKALYSNVSGNENTAIGSMAGYNSLGSGNVFIGRYAGYDETGSNKLYIDNSNTENPLIYGDFSTNQVEINGSLDILSTVTTQTDVIAGDDVEATDDVIAGGDITAGGDMVVTGDYAYASAKTKIMKIPAASFDLSTNQDADKMAFNIDGYWSITNDDGNGAYNLQAGVYLPEGAIVTKFSIYYGGWDESITVSLKERSPINTHDENMAQITASPVVVTATTKYDDLSIISPSINNTSYFYYITAEFTGHGASDAGWLYGAEIEYTISELK